MQWYMFNDVLVCVFDLVLFHSVLFRSLDSVSMYSTHTK